MLTDLRMPGIGWAGAVWAHRAQPAGHPVIVVTAFRALETAVAAIRARAYDFVASPSTWMRWCWCWSGRCSTALQDEVRRLRQELGPGSRTARWSTRAPPSQQAYALIDRVADLDSTVLITGRAGREGGGPRAPVHTRARASGRGAVRRAQLRGDAGRLAGGASCSGTRRALTDAKAARTGLFVQARRDAVPGRGGAVPLTLSEAPAGAAGADGAPGGWGHGGSVRRAHRHDDEPGPGAGGGGGPVP